MLLGHKHKAGLTILYSFRAGSMSKYPQHWLDIVGMKKGHGKRRIMFEAVPMVDSTDTREIKPRCKAWTQTQSFLSLSEFIGLQMRHLVQLLKLGARKSSDADMVCNFPLVEHEKLGVWTGFTYHTENKLLFMSQWKKKKKKIIIIRKRGLLSIQNSENPTDFLVSRKNRADRNLSADYLTGFSHCFSFHAECSYVESWLQSVIEKNAEHNGLPWNIENSTVALEEGACLHPWQIHRGHKPLACLPPHIEVIILTSLCSHWRKKCTPPEGKLDVQIFWGVVWHMALTIEFRECSL